MALKRKRLDDGQPSTTAANGQDPRTGRFIKGNTIAKGNPHAKRVARLRSALLDAIDEKTVRSVIRALAREATSGNVPAARELLDRCIGRTPFAVELMDDEHDRDDRYL